MWIMACGKAPFAPDRVAHAVLGSGICVEVMDSSQQHRVAEARRTIGRRQPSSLKLTSTVPTMA